MEASGYGVVRKGGGFNCAALMRLAGFSRIARSVNPANHNPRSNESPRESGDVLQFFIVGREINADSADGLAVCNPVGTRAFG